MKAGIVKPVLLVFVVVAATTGAGIQRGWADTGELDTVLLNGDSRTWKMDSSGDLSPDGIWRLVHPGHGYAQVTDAGIMNLRPEIEDSSRHSTLVLADDIGYTGIHGKMKVRLDKQSDDPKAWDSFWAMLAYVDKTTQINFIVKSDDAGWMVTKRDHDHEGQDLHEVLAQGHSYFKEVDFGHWYNLEWWIYPHDGNLHIKLIVDGHTLIDKQDPGHYDRNDHEGSGTSKYFEEADKTVGAYSEKSYSSWKEISVEKYHD